MICIGKTPIAEMVNSMSPGQCARVSAHEIMREYPTLGLYGGGGLQGAIDRFLSSCVGSAYGTVRCDVDLLEPVVRISVYDADPRADHGGVLYHVDSDRQWMFDRIPGGFQRRVTVGPEEEAPEYMRDLPPATP